MLELAKMPPEAALDDAALDASVPVKEPSKDDKDESDDEPEFDDRPRASVSDRLFCCETDDKRVDVWSEVVVSLLDEGADDEEKTVAVTFGNDLLTSRGK